jgi:hypothetical protein
MKKNSIINLIEKAANEDLNNRLNAFADAAKIQIGDSEGQVSKAEALEQLEQAQEALFALFTGTNYKGESVEVPLIDLKEALVTADVSVLFPRVITEIMLEPVEPNLFLMNNATEEMRLSPKHPLTIEFQSMGALEAGEVAENGEYPSMQLSYGQHMQSIRIKKIGLQVPLGEDVINQSVYPLITYTMKAMKRAVDRKIEGFLYARMVGAAKNVFDNTSANTAYHTTGKASNQSANYTFSYNDLVKMFGVMIGYRYNPTHFLSHPLAWGIFAQDPIIRAQFYHMGQLGSGVWNTAPQFNQQTNFPFGITYVPYYAIAYSENATLSGIGSALGATLLSDAYLIDANNALFMATRGPAEMDSMEDWYKDARTMKIRKHVGISAKEGGNGMVSAKNLRNEINYEPIMTVRQVS